jgi:hypothetical protein
MERLDDPKTRLPRPEEKAKKFAPISFIREAREELNEARRAIEKFMESFLEKNMPEDVQNGEVDESENDYALLLSLINSIATGVVSDTQICLYKLTKKPTETYMDTLPDSYTWSEALQVLPKAFAQVNREVVDERGRTRPRLTVHTRTDESTEPENLVLSIINEQTKTGRVITQVRQLMVQNGFLVYQEQVARKGRKEKEVMVKNVIPNSLLAGTSPATTRDIYISTQIDQGKINTMLHPPLTEKTEGGTKWLRTKDTLEASSMPAPIGEEIKDIREETIAQLFAFLEEFHNLRRAPEDPSVIANQERILATEEFAVDWGHDQSAA